MVNIRINSPSPGFSNYFSSSNSNSSPSDNKDGKDPDSQKNSKSSDSDPPENVQPSNNPDSTIQVNPQPNPDIGEEEGQQEPNEETQTSVRSALRQFFHTLLGHTTLIYPTMNMFIFGEPEQLEGIANDTATETGNPDNAEQEVGNPPVSTSGEEERIEVPILPFSNFTNVQHVGSEGLDDSVGNTQGQVNPAVSGDMNVEENRDAMIPVFYVIMNEDENDAGADEHVAEHFRLALLHLLAHLHLDTAEGGEEGEGQQPRQDEPSDEGKN